MDEEQALAKAGGDAVKLKRAADAEALDNEQDFLRRCNDPVLFGQIVQLLHVASERSIRASPINTSRREARYCSLSNRTEKLMLLIKMLSDRRCLFFCLHIIALND